MCYVMLYAWIIKIKLTFFPSLHDIKTWAVLWYNLPKTKARTGRDASSTNSKQAAQYIKQGSERIQISGEMCWKTLMTDLAKAGNYSLKENNHRDWWLQMEKNSTSAAETLSSQAEVC